MLRNPPGATPRGPLGQGQGVVCLSGTGRSNLNISCDNLGEEKGGVPLGEGPGSQIQANISHKSSLQLGRLLRNEGGPALFPTSSTC